MTRTHADRLAHIEAEQRVMNDQLKRGDQKFDRMEAALAEILDRSRARDGEIAAMRLEQGQRDKAIHDKMDGVKREVAAMRPHVETIAMAKTGVRVGRRVAAWVGGMAAGAVALWSQFGDSVMKLWR